MDRCVNHFEHIKELARPAEVSNFENLIKTAQRAIANPGPEFRSLLGQLWSKTFDILYRQEWFIVDRFKWLAESPHLFLDADKHTELVTLGMSALQSDDFEKLRQVVGVLDAIQN